MTKAVTSIVVVGGGSAGWLTAGMLAAKHKPNAPDGINITLIESPNIKTIGVGEGTWPTMRSTLRSIGVSETEFIRQCDVSFKQGTKFVGWRDGGSDDVFYQPFELPQGYFEQSLAPFWLASDKHKSFSTSVCHQEAVCEKHLAPKTITTPEFEHVVNYAYHLNAGKFSEFIKKHCVEKLGVNHILDDVTGIESHANGHIKSLKTANNGELEGQLYVDCTGFSSLLLGKHFDVPFVDKSGILFINKAIAMQVPYAEESSDIVSATVSTAHQAGWIWDIGLQNRRGTGIVYSDQFMGEDEAMESLLQYAGQFHSNPESLMFKSIDIKGGHRKLFWKENCVAIGLSAGFLEPLEASALALVEYSAKLLSERLPRTVQAIEFESEHFNQQMHYHWERIIDFLKLHYVLSKRTEPFWVANRDEKSMPDSLIQNLQCWQFRVPEMSEFTHAEEVFPAVAYQYVMYGMGFTPELPGYLTSDPVKQELANAMFQANQQMTMQSLQHLQSNRDLLNKIFKHGLQTI